MILCNLNQLFHLHIQSYIIFNQLKLYNSSIPRHATVAVRSCVFWTCVFSRRLLFVAGSEDHYHLLQIYIANISPFTCWITLEKTNISPFTLENKYLSVANFNLASLLPSMLHKILSKVAITSIWDFGSARFSFSGLTQLAKKITFTNLPISFSWMTGHMRSMLFEHSSLGATKWVIKPYTCKVCMNTSSSIYLMKEGKKFIFLVREDACWPNMLMVLWTWLLVLIIEYVDHIYHVVISWALSGHWGYNKPEMFISLLGRIERNVSYDCWCCAIIEPVFVVSIDGSRTRWKCERCFWQCAVCDFCNEIHLTARDWPIED